MLHHRKLMGVSLLALALAVPGVAQETAPTTPAPETTQAPDAGAATTPSPAPAVEAADCDGQFTALDTDGSSTLSEAEAPQVFARSRVDDMTIAETGYTRDEFLAACAADDYARAEPEVGAPFEGANSFTEGQAQDRAVAWGVTDVSALTKDDQGIWRGTGMVDGANVAVAIDYKGNVVTTAQQP